MRRLPRPKPIKRKMIEVEWLDSHTNDPWEPIREARKGGAGILVRSLGFFVAESAVHLTIASSVDFQDCAGSQDGTYACFGQIAIPIVSITAKRYLR